MKKLVALLFFLCCTLAYGQDSQVNVTLKSGAVMKGMLLELNPREYLRLSIAGVETKISMDDIQSIENISNKKDVSDNQKTDISNLTYGYYSITDNRDYPEVVNVEIAGEKMEMRLIRGGWFIMGYDARHSWAMDSEPIHKVNISSFYISTKCLSQNQANILRNSKNKPEKKRISYDAVKWKNAKEIVDAIANNTNKPFRLCTEAEWEYSSLMDFSDEIFGAEKQLEWCNDFFGEFNNSEQTNPKGPTNGNKHVLRSFTMGRNKWDRSLYKFSQFDFRTVVRIAISADKL